jgi:hypothetical protein
MTTLFVTPDQGVEEPDSSCILKINAKDCRESIQISATQGKLNTKMLDIIMNNITEQGKLVLAINKYEDNSFVFTFIKKNIIDATIKVFLQNDCKLDKIQLVNDKMEVATITPFGFMVQSEFDITHQEDGSYRVDYPGCFISPKELEYTPL